MIVNACVENGKMVDKNICRNCSVETCRHTGEPTTKEKLDMGTYGTARYWDGETDNAV